MLNILGMGYAYPKTVIDNEFLEALGTGTTAAWIREKIGIETRLSTLPLEYIAETRNARPQDAPKAASMTPTDLGVTAAKMALDRAGIKASQVGLVLCNGCTPVETSPAESQRIATKLGISSVKAYDVFTACPAFALHIDFLNNFQEKNLPDYILSVSTAVLTQNVNYNDRTDGAIWGDGASAVVLSPKKDGKLRVLDSYYMGDPTRCNAVVVDTHGFFHQDGRAVRNFSVLQTVKLVRQVEAKHPHIRWDRDIFIGHQANYTMLQQIIENRGIPSSQHWYNVVTVGNQAGAGAPAALAMNWDNIKPGMNIVVAVVGAGLSWGSVLLEAA